MKCNKIKERFSDLLTGEIDETTRKEIENHVAACGLCREELESLSAIWTKLGVLPEEQPGSNVRTRFYATLEKYKKSLEQEKAKPHLGKILDGWFERWVPRRPVFQFSFALILLVVGLAAGYFLHASWQRSGDIARLRQEVSQIRQLAAVSLLQQESVSEQLKGIGLISQMEMPDEETLEAFLRTLDSGTDINLSLAAIDALFRTRDYSISRQELIESLSEQASPLIQIALTLTSQMKNF